MSSGTQKAMIILLTATLLIAAGVVTIRHQIAEEFRPKATWGTETLHLWSAKDGPWIITHLVKLREGTNEYAVARLPCPALVIDSRGEIFTTNFLQSLDWITHSGTTSSPPTYGHPMKAFYFVPEATK
jgi:hypothetical protein